MSVQILKTAYDKDVAEFNTIIVENNLRKFRTDINRINKYGKFCNGFVLHSLQEKYDIHINM